ncbi:MAG: branched-chain amino acid ABC transporter substrate-binding protein [Caldilineaceae bacterium]|nr:branched-chain amino acid ABC transporter substrate-binding protein [Caldilineaceae bacterium]MDE0180657.1 branched-chain amino acid ABC transporter substrate-binding protein [Caldilineaceae bacterium]
MKTRQRFRRPLTLWTLLFSLLVLPAACVPVDFETPALGTVVVGSGEDIHIRSLGALTRVGDLGVPSQRGVALAIADYGPIKGHNVTMGAGIDSLCSAHGGAAAAETVTGDARVVGVIGTSCSVAAAAASPILSQAGLVMVAPSTTSPSLTSDLRGSAGSNHYAGYHRTASNDLYQAQAVADFVYNELELRNMAAIHDGDPYTLGLVTAFTAAFEELGGSVAVAAINKGDTDMLPVLTQLAQGNPDGLFIPIFPEEAEHILQQSQQVDALAGLARIGGGGLLVSDFLAIPESEGIYFAGPELDFGGNVNEATGRSGEELIAAYHEQYNEGPTSAYLAHAYDATTLLLRAIEEVAVVQGDTLYIDRAKLRAAVTGTSGFSGIIGTLSCDEFGDCGTGRVQITHHTDSSMPDVEGLPVVYRYAP